jgi:hypothetical protein
MQGIKLENFNQWFWVNHLYLPAFYSSLYLIKKIIDAHGLKSNKEYL